ncbi:MAG: hypothetical protein HXY21_12035 [Parvularculaceae bacterium]|nr:hypothetical protein [Parvularculaceae bacterium]
MRLIPAALSLTLAVSCATSAKMTLNDRFKAIGLSAEMADCMVDDLDDRLSDEDIRDLARYAAGLSRADTPGQAVDALLEFDNPRAVAAIGRAAFSCVTGFVR